MRLVVDGIIYENQAWGGISRTFSAILPLMCEADPSLEVELRSIPAFRRQSLPAHARIHSVDVPHLRPARVFGWVAPGAQSQARAGMPRRDILQATYYTRPPLWRGPQVVAAYDMIHVRYAHLWTAEAEEAFRREQRRTLEAADAVICNSEATRQDVLRFLNVTEDRLHVVHLSHDPVFAPRPDAPPAARPFLLYVGGRGHPYKGFGTLLDAYARWPHAGDVGLTVVGEDWNERERAHLQALGLLDRVERLDTVTDEHLATLYATAAAYVYPSHIEGFGIPQLEAMACRCPLVAADIPTTAEVAGDVAIQFVADDPDSLADALTRALTPDAARLDRGVARAGTFSWARAAAETLAIYRAL